MFRINTNCSCFLLNCCPLIYIIIPFHSLINEVCLQTDAHSQVFTIILALNLCLKCGIFLPIGFEFETTYFMHAYVIFSWQAFNNMCVTDSKRFPIYIDRRQQPKKPSPLPYSTIQKSPFCCYTITKGARWLFWNHKKSSIVVL